MFGQTKRVALVAFMAMSATPLLAQTAPVPVVSAAPPETVTVTGNRTVPAITVDHFVKATAAPTFFLGKLARWNEAICYKVSGLNPVENALRQRVLEVAAMVRAKADTRPSCRANVEIVFSATPQAVLDDIRKHNPDTLGFHDDSTSQAKQMAVMTRPIQAWYATQVRDGAGEVAPEQRYAACVQQRGGVVSPVYVETPVPGNNLPPDYFRDITRNAKLCGTMGKSSLIANSISSEFSNVLVVADSGKLSGFSVTSLEDYIAMLVLSPAQPPDTCQELPTIANLLAPHCPAANVPGALTDVDIAYLKALYAMDPDEDLHFQQGDIASRMKRALNPQ